MRHAPDRSMNRFRNRAAAGRELAAQLRSHADQNPIVLALPRGGVPVGQEIAEALGAELDVWVVRKLGVPWHPELGVGAVAEGGFTHVNTAILGQVGLSDDELGDLVDVKRSEVAELVKRFRAGRPSPALERRTVILVDDGIATGGTVLAAIRSIRAQNPARLILAVPVAAPQTLATLEPEVDEIICPRRPADLYAIGLWYEDFRQVSDDEVADLLDRARRAEPRSDDSVLVIPAGAVRLEGDLAIPTGARGLVLFAHGSGSSRKSSRNRFVAQTLRDRGLGTLLFDLLTPEEERLDAVYAQYRFDIPLLAERLGAATDWLRSQLPAPSLRLGYFGSSTGAAAALIAAARRPGQIRAVVSRGGRPDLAAETLARVQSPTLLIVGGADPIVLELNEDALARIGAPKDLAIIPGASHLFEETGALEQVAALAGDWFAQYLGAPTRPEVAAPR